MTYNIPYFIKKFEAIPEDKWCTGEFDLNGRHCVFGHCGMSAESTVGKIPEAQALTSLFHRYGGGAVATNDDFDTDRNLGQGHEVSRDRILAALNWIQKQEEKA